MSSITEPQKGDQKQTISLEDLFGAFPAAIYATDAGGNVTFYNRAAEVLAGRTPRLGEDQWRACWRLHSADGAPPSLALRPMAVTLKTGSPVRGVELIAVRPDGATVPVLPFATPLRDASGALVGAVNMLVDITALKEAQDAARRRAEEQAALYRFTDRLLRATTIEDVYDAALEAIVAGLGCSRASILGFDADGVTQVLALRGLSQAYRQAVAGRSPWTPGQRNADAIWLEDVAGVEDALRPALEREGVGALGFIPVAAHGGVIGNFMACHDAPHRWTPGEADLALTIARQLGFAIERQRARGPRRQRGCARAADRDR